MMLYVVLQEFAMYFCFVLFAQPSIFRAVEVFRWDVGRKGKWELMALQPNIR